MEKINFNNIISNLCSKHKINDSKFRVKLCDFLITNNWFGFEKEVINNILYVDADISSKKEIHEFCKSYNLNVEEKINLLYRKFNKAFPITKKLFVQYAKEKKLRTKDIYYSIDALCYGLAGEIITSTDIEISSLLDSAEENLNKHTCEVICDFIIWVKASNKTMYQSIPKMNRRFKINNDAYSLDIYLKMVYYLVNKEYITKNKMFQKSVSSSAYINIWLYLSLHFVCALRNTDLLALPHPPLPFEADVVLKKVYHNEFSDEDSLKIYNFINCYIDSFALKPNKTKRFNNISNINFDIPQSFETFIGKLFAIAEAHFIIEDKSPEKPLIVVKTKYSTIKRVMGTEIGELFKDSDFRARSANKSYMQLLQTVGNKESDDSLNMKGYMVASIARSHKGSYKKYAQTTIKYLEDAKMSKLSPELVMKELFERGVCSYQSSYLLSMVTNNGYKKLSATNQTKLIKSLNLSPYEIENISKTSKETIDKSLALLKDSLKTKKSITAILHRIANNDAPSKIDKVPCLITAARKKCPYNDRTNCLFCDYEILTKHVLRLLISNYLSNKDLYESEKNIFIKNKYKSLINEIILPKINEILICSKDYGNDVYKSIERIIKDELYNHSNNSSI